MVLVKDIQQKGISSAYIEAPFDKGKEILEQEGYRIISLEENAKLRIQQGESAFVSQNGNWTIEGVLYILKKGKFLTKKSPIMTNAKQATECHRNGQDFYLNSEQVEQSLADCVEFPSKSIPTDRFAENEITVYVFGNVAEDYGKFLKEVGINKMPIYLTNLHDKPFVRQMWFGDLDGRSELDGNYGDLGGDNRLLGVRNSAEGMQENIEVYTLRDIQRALKSTGLMGIEKLLVNELKK